MEEFDIGYPHSKAKRTVKDGYRTIKNRIKAFELGKDYYDGDRENGYGGFKYDGRWAKIIPTIIKRYNLTNKSAVLDLGCKKGFFMHDLKEALPGIKVRGIECSQYPIDNAMESVKDDVILSGYEKLPFEDNEFDFVFSNSFDHSIYPAKFISEMERVLKPGGYGLLHLQLTKKVDDYAENIITSEDPVISLLTDSKVCKNKNIKGSCYIKELVFEKD